jgi:hypothetical protein
MTTETNMGAGSRTAMDPLEEARWLAGGGSRQELATKHEGMGAGPQPAPVAPVVPRANRTVDDEVLRLAASTGRVHIAAGVTPAGSKREQRGHGQDAKRRMREVQRERQRAKKRETRRRFEERRNTQYLPEAGEKRPQALRTYRPARAASTQVTADVAAYAYPFLAEAGLGSQGILVGVDAWSGAAFVFDPWVLYELNMLTNANMLVAGIIGRGKSALVKSLVTRSITVGRRCYVACDPKGEWTEISRAVGGQAIVLGTGSSNRLNPLDAPPRPGGVGDLQWSADVRRRRLELLKALVETALGRGLHAVENTALDVALDTAVAATVQPLLGRVVSELLSPLEGIVGVTRDELAKDGRDVGHALRRLVDGDLKGLFDGPSTVSFDPSLPMVSIDMSGVSGSDTALALVSACGAAWIESALADPNGGRRYIVYDEAWRLLRSPALLARMQSDWKLSRARGISNVMVIHRLSDLDAVGDEKSEARSLALGLLADCSIKVIYAQERGEATATGRRLGLSDVEIEELPGLQRGQGLWRVGERSFLVNHRLTEGELALFDTNQRMVEKPRGLPASEAEFQGTRG